MSEGLLALWITDLLNLQHWLTSPLVLVVAAFTIWMLIDAIRRQEWFWVVLIILFPLLNAFLYYLLVYRSAPPLGGFRLELPGSGDRSRIQELEKLIHHLDKAHHHAELGDIYFRQGKFEAAENCYRDALDRDAEEEDARSRLGQCLVRLGRPQEALPLLERVCSENPKHDYGHSLMALAEAHMLLGDRDRAAQTWERVLENHSYARARVELAELYLASGQEERARMSLRQVLADDAHAPPFQRKQERSWIQRAQRLLNGIS
jgi:tetratricopeptide (TPR) repeat protein